MGKMNDRNSNVEVFRFVLMMGVCLVHLFYHGLGFTSPSDATIFYKDLILISLVVPSVNCFMFISGYYGIQLKKEKLLYMVLQASFVFWGVVFVRNAFGFFGGEVGWSLILPHIFPASSKTWWFLTEYITIMLLSPFINKGIECMSKEKFQRILFLLGFINCIGLYMASKHNGSDLLGLLFVYMLARYIRIYYKHICFRNAAIVWIVSSVVIAGVLCVLHYFNRDVLIKGVLFYCNPLIILQSVGLFFMINSLKKQVPSCLNWFGKHCFAIYLVTEWSGFYFYKQWAKLYRENDYLFLFFSILAISIVIMLADCVQGYLNKKLSALFGLRSQKQQMG